MGYGLIENLQQFITPVIYIRNIQKSVLIDLQRAFQEIEIINNQKAIEVF